MKKMKPNQIAGLVRPGFAGVTANSRGHLCLMAGRSIALCALVTQCLNLAWAADTLPSKEPGSQLTPARKPAYTPQGHQMERYKAFARQAELPAITVADSATLEVGGTVRTDLNRLAQLSTKEQESLAGQLGVPAGVIGKVVERAASNEQPNAAQLAQDIRAAVIDYRFLEGEWKRYSPPADGQQIKADALAALQTGDINKAWELYDGLKKPQAPIIAPPSPPTGLRVVSQQ